MICTSAKRQDTNYAALGSPTANNQTTTDSSVELFCHNTAAEEKHAEMTSLVQTSVRTTQPRFWSGIAKWKSKLSYPHLTKIKPSCFKIQAHENLQLPVDIVRRILRRTG